VFQEHFQSHIVKEITPAFLSEPSYNNYYWSLFISLCILRFILDWDKNLARDIFWDQGLEFQVK